MVEDCRITLDQRHLEGSALAAMLAEAKQASADFAKDVDVTVDWTRLWQIEPILFNDDLIELCDEAIMT